MIRRAHLLPRRSTVQQQPAGRPGPHAALRVSKVHRQAHRHINTRTKAGARSRTHRHTLSHEILQKVTPPACPYIRQGSAVCRRPHTRAVHCHLPSVTAPSPQSMQPSPPAAASHPNTPSPLRTQHSSLSSCPHPFPQLTSRASTAAPRPTSAFTDSTRPGPPAPPPSRRCTSERAAWCRGVPPCGGRGASGAARRAARAIRRRSKRGTPSWPAGYGTRQRRPPIPAPCLPQPPPFLTQATRRAAALRGARQDTPTPPCSPHPVRAVGGGGGERGVSGPDGQSVAYGAGGDMRRRRSDRNKKCSRTLTQDRAF